MLVDKTVMLIAAAAEVMMIMMMWHITLTFMWPCHNMTVHRRRDVVTSLETKLKLHSCARLSAQLVNQSNTADWNCSAWQDSVVGKACKYDWVADVSWEDASVDSSLSVWQVHSLVGQRSRPRWVGGLDHTHTRVRHKVPSGLARPLSVWRALGHTDCVCHVWPGLLCLLQTTHVH